MTDRDRARPEIGTGILDGVRVLDLTRVVAGPACTRVLADLGAEVIKVEPPEGDLLRSGHPRRGGHSVLFAGQNAGKRFTAVDLTRPEGVELLLRLAERCDVVVENFRPGVADRLGVGYEQVAARRPDIVYCSISGYGQDGRASQRRAYAPVVHAEVGLLHHKAKEQGQEPTPEPVSHADIAVGMAAAQAVLAALFRRERGGGGAWIDASMCEAMLATNEWTEVEVNGGPDYERSPFRPGRAPVVQLGDEEGTWVAIPGSPAAVLPHCLRLWGNTAPLDDERFATIEARSRHLEECVELISAFAAGFDRFEDFERTMSEGARLPVGRLVALADTVDADWAVDRDAFVDVPSGDETVRVHRSPVRIGGWGCGPRSGVRHLGADNHEVFAEVLGLADAALAELAEQGALVERPHFDLHESAAPADR
jgi:crotonobetainyl-CoA:carnitine CoA-transferase CaiB-like acyl-CoA transferase